MLYLLHQINPQENRMKLFNRSKKNATETTVLMAGGAQVAEKSSDNSAVDALLAEIAPNPVSSEVESAVAAAEISEIHAAQPGEKSPEQIAAEQKIADETAKAAKK